MPKPKLVLKTYDEINKSRKSMRKILVLISLPFILVIALLSLKTTSMYVLAGETISSYDEGKYNVAQQKATQQKSTNVLEEWLAYYNSGSSLAAEEKYSEAIQDFQKAKNLVNGKIPAVCYIDANLAISYEKNGDLLAEKQNKVEAEKNYLLAVEVADASPPECSTPEGGGTGESLSETRESASGKAEALAEGEEDSDTGTGNQEPEQPNESSTDGREQIQEQLDQSDSDRQIDEQTEENQGKEPASKPW